MKGRHKGKNLTSKKACIEKGLQLPREAWKDRIGPRSEAAGVRHLDSFASGGESTRGWRPGCLVTGDFKKRLKLGWHGSVVGHRPVNPSSGLPCVAAREQGVSFPLVDKPGPCSVHLTQTLRCTEQIVADAAAVPNPHPPLLTQLKGRRRLGCSVQNQDVKAAGSFIYLHPGKGTGGSNPKLCLPC